MKVKISEFSSELQGIIRAELESRKLDGEIQLEHLGKSTQAMISRENARNKKEPTKKKETKKKEAKTDDDAQKREIYERLGLEYQEDGKFVYESSDGRKVELDESEVEHIIDAFRASIPCRALDSPYHAPVKLATF